MDNGPLPITVRDGRFVTIASAGADLHMVGRGFLWFDLQTGVAMGGIYFHPTNGEPTPTVTVFSQQLTDPELSMGQLPEPFAEDLDMGERSAGAFRLAPLLHSR